MLSNKLEPCWVYCCEYANDDNKLVGFRSRKVEAKHAGRPLHAPRRAAPHVAAARGPALLLLLLFVHASGAVSINTTSSRVQLRRSLGNGKESLRRPRAGSPRLVNRTRTRGNWAGAQGQGAPGVVRGGGLGLPKNPKP